MNRVRSSVYVIILIFILLIILIIIAVIIFRPKIQEGNINIQKNIPNVWSPSTSSGNCNGYQFPPSSPTSLGIPTFNSSVVNTLESISGGYSCIWPDQLNEQEYYRTCLSSSCTGMDGNIYTEGQQEYYYDYCGNTVSRCQGSLGVIIVDYLLPPAMCISSSGNTTLLTEIDFYDENQLFVESELNDKSPICMFYQRSSGYVLDWVSGSLYLRPSNSSHNKGYVWIKIPPMNFQVDNLRVSSPASLGYVGDLNLNFLNLSELKTNVDIRNFVIANNIMVLEWANSLFSLGQWTYSRDEKLPYTYFVSAYQIERIPS